MKPHFKSNYYEQDFNLYHVIFDIISQTQGINHYVLKVLSLSCSEAFGGF